MSKKYLITMILAVALPAAALAAGMHGGKTATSSCKSGTAMVCSSQKGCSESASKDCGCGDSCCCCCCNCGCKSSDKTSTKK